MADPTPVPVEFSQTVDLHINDSAELTTVRSRSVTMLVTRLQITYIWRRGSWNTYWSAYGRRRLQSGAWSDKVGGYMEAIHLTEIPGWITETIQKYRPATDVPGAEE